ncbi:hypothetical protein GMJAKD_15635 [Candidatus Electrothrix aarhusensis]
MNNLSNKNSLIGALVILLLVTSWWGQSETGANKQLTREKKAAEVQLAAVEAESASTRQALQEKTAALTDAEKKLSMAKTQVQNLAKKFSEKKSALIALNKEERVLLEKINELELALKNAKDQQAQAGSEQQQNVQETVAAHNEALTKLKKAEGRIAQLEKELTELKTRTAKLKAQAEKEQKKLKAQAEKEQAELKAQAENKQAELKAQAEKKQAELKAQAEKEQAELKAQAGKEQAELKAQAEREQAELKAQAEDQIAQLWKKQDEATAEAESLQAQVIGFEKVVEERNAALAEVGNELHDCKVNTKILLSKITEQENTQQGMQEKMHMMVQDLSAKAAYEQSTPVQQELPAQAK